MKFVAYLHSVASKLLRRSETAAELEQELRSHIALRADDMERSGLSRENYRGRRVAFPSGAVAIGCSLLALAPLAILDDRGRPVTSRGLFECGERHRV